MFKKVLQNFMQKSEIGALLNQSKTVYKEHRADSGRLQSVYSAAKYSGKELGVVNSIFAGIGVIGGTIFVPVPGGAIIAAEGMLKTSKYFGKCIKSVGKYVNTIC